MLEPALFVLFGAGGDLAKRKLFPALYRLYQKNTIPATFAVVGTGRTMRTDDEFRKIVKESLVLSENLSTDPQLEKFLSSFFYVPTDLHNESDYGRLLQKIEECERQFSLPGNRLFYLAVSPELFAPIALNLKQSGALRSSGWTRLMIEKPFGEDEASAKELNRQLREGFDESEIFRIDHYLGKEMVQNIHIIRFANLFLEPLWNRHYIECVQITASETIGVGERSQFYNRTGALRDMVQNHLLQMLMLVAMEPPSSLDPEAIHREKIKVLTSLRRYREEEVAEHVVRGQYREGRLSAEDVVAYRQEKGVPNDSQTETYVAVTAWLDNLRWEGVPFYLRTGKRLAKKATEIVIQFKSIPGNFYFPNQTPTPNRLVISIQPTEAIYLVVNSKRPGQTDQLIPAVMEFCHNCETESPEAYEALLHDAWLGDRTFFTHGDEVEMAWRWIDPIRQAFANNLVPLDFYESGSWGPKEADALLAKRGHHWWPVARRDFS